MATLTHHWKLDEGSGTNCVDIVSGDDTTITAVSGYPTWISGLIGSGFALTFGGNTNTFPDRLYLSGEDRVVGCGTVYFSMTCWVKTTSSAAKPIFGQTAFEDTGLSRGFGVNPGQVNFYLGSDGKAHFYITAATPSTVRKQVESSGVINDGTVHFLAATLEQSGSDYILRLYVDAVLEASLTSADPIVTNPQGADVPICIGCGNVADTTRLNDVDSNAYGSFGGSIDDPRIYCGALTSGEIENLYNEGLMKAVTNAIMFSCNT